MILTRIKSLTAIGALGLLLPAVASADSFLVENGVPKAEIVIAADAVPVIRVAAEFLQSEVEKMTGAQLPETDATASSDFIEQRARAVALIEDKKPGDALALFTDLAGDETLADVQRADAMEQAVECLIQLERIDEAEALAKQVESEPVSVLCQMRLLKTQGQGDALVEQFKEHDFSGWADDRKGEAYLLRGNAAYFGRKDPEIAALAKRDLEEALLYAVTFRSRDLVQRRIESYLGKLRDGRSDRGGR